MLFSTGFRNTAANNDAPDALFTGKTFEDIGTDQELTNHVLRTYDPDGSKYGGDVAALKNGLLNELTTRKSGTVSSALDWMASRSETLTQKQNSNLAERLYESAPNRLFAKDSTISERMQALGSGLKGGIYGESLFSPTELALNIAMSPLLLAKAGIPLLSGLAKGATGAGMAGKALAGASARDFIERTAAGEVMDEATRATLMSAIKKDTWRSTWKAQAAFEGGTNALLGGVGGATEHYAAQNRGIETGSLTGDVLGGAAMGGLVGGVFGGIGGHFEGKRLGRELVGETPMGAELTRAGLKNVNDMGADGLAARLAEEQAARDAEAGIAPPPAPDTTVRDRLIGKAADLRQHAADVDNPMLSFASEIEDAAKRQTPGAGKLSKGTQFAISRVMGDNSDLPSLISTLRQQADAMEASEAVTPDLRLQAGNLRTRAEVISRFHDDINSDDAMLGDFLSSGKLSNRVTSAVVAIDPSLASIIDADLNPGKPARAAPGAATPPAGPTAPNAPAGAAPTAPAAPVAPPAPTAAAANAAAEAAPPVAPPEAINVGAAEVEQLRPRMSPDDAAAFADAESLLTAAGMDAGTLMSRIASEGGLAGIVSDVVKATAQPAPEVQAKLGRATGSITKARAARDAEGQTAPKATAEAPAEKAAEAPDAPAAPAATEQVAPPTEQVDPPTEQVDPPIQFADEAAEQGAFSYEQLALKAKTTRVEAKQAITEIQANFLERMQANAATPSVEAEQALIADIDKALDGLRDSDLSLTVALRGVSGADLMTPAGIAKVEARLLRASSESVSWHYASAITPLMNDVYNTTDFEKLLSLMPGIPDSARRQISADYKRYTREAIGSRIAELGEAEARRVYGSEALNGVFASEASMGKVDVQSIIADATEGLSSKEAQRLGKIVRDFHKQLTGLGSAGMWFDETLLSSALRHRAAAAKGEVSSEAVRAANPELFKRLDAVNAQGKDDYIIDVGRAAEAYALTGNDDNLGSSMYPNPVINRLLTDKHGNFVPAWGTGGGELVSGRSLSGGKDGDGNKKGFGKAGLNQKQGILSNTAGMGYYGPLFSVARTTGATRAVLREGQKAAIDATSNRRWSTMIDGKKVSASEKELKGLIFEGQYERMEAQRMNRIIEAARQRVTGTEEAYRAEIEAAGKLMRAVTPSEEAFAREFIESSERLASARVIARKRASDILEDMRASGKNLDDVSADLMARLQKVMRDHEESTLIGVKGMERDSGAGDKKKTTSDAKVQRKKERSDAVVFSSSDPKDKASYEFIPTKHLEFADDGSLKLFGNVVGTYERGENGSFTLKLTGENEVVTAQGINSVAKKVKGTKVGRATLEANKKRMAEGDVGVDLPDGATIPEGFTKTEEIAAAKVELTGEGGSALTPELRATSPDDIAVPAGFRLILREEGTRNFTIPKPFHKTLGDAIGPDEAGLKWVVGYVPVRQNRSGGISHQLGSIDKLIADFVPMGKDPRAVDPGLERVMASVKADQNSAPALAAARRGPISLRQAAQIKTADGRTLAELHQRFTDLSIRNSLDDSVDGLNKLISLLDSLEAEISELAPHGIMRTTANRRTSFLGLSAALSKAPRAELDIAMDLLRRIDGNENGLPHFTAAGYDNGWGSGWFNPSAPKLGEQGNWIGIDGGAMPAHFAVAHEVAHWAYVNILSQKEQIEFLRTLRKHYGSDGRLDAASVNKVISGARAIESAVGHGYDGLGGQRGVVSNELFAWEFTNYFMDTVRSGARTEEAGLWKRMTSIVKGLLDHFFGKSADIDPELRTLFEKILPPSPKETRNRYDQMADRATGELVSATAPIDGDKRHATGVMLAGYSRLVDELRGTLDSHLFSLDSPLAGPLASDLQTAAQHMWGLMRGQDTGSVTTGLRQALRITYKKATGWARDADGGVVKSETETRKTESRFGKKPAGRAAGVQTFEYVPSGTVNYWNLFGRDGGGMVMAEAGEQTRLVKALKNAEEGNFEGVIDIAGSEMDEQARMFYAKAEPRMDELMAGGMSQADAAAKAEAETLKALGLDAIPEGRSAWEAATAGLESSERASAALRAVSLQVRDLMTDALEHFEAALKKNGFELRRSELAVRELPVAEDAVRTAAVKAVDEAAKVSAVKPAKVRQPAPPPTESAMQAAMRKAQQSAGVDIGAGVPEGAPAQVTNLTARITHRDPVQESITDGIGYDIFNLLGIEHPTNADLSRLTGVNLEEGVEPDAPAADNAVFKEFRAILRRVSESLTNENKDPISAARELAEMISLGSMDESINSTTVANAVVATIKNVRNSASLPAAEQRALDKMESDHEFGSAVREVLGSVLTLLEGRAASKAAKTALPDADASTLAHTLGPVFTADSGLHPAFAQAAVSRRIASLSDGAKDELARVLGITPDGDLDALLARAVVFHQPGTLSGMGLPTGSTVSLTTNPKFDWGKWLESSAAASGGQPNPVAKALVDELQQITARLGTDAPGAKDAQKYADMAVRRQHVIEALRRFDSFSDLSDAAVPMLVNPQMILDAGNADPLALVSLVNSFVQMGDAGKLTAKAKDPALRARLMEAVSAGNGEVVIREISSVVATSKLPALMKEAEIAGYRLGGDVVLFDRSALMPLDETLSQAVRGSVAEPQMGDAALAGEGLLRMSLGGSDGWLEKVDSIGWSQRAAQGGADAETSAVVGRMAPGKGVPRDGEAVLKVAQKFSSIVQLRSNSSRMAKAGGRWVAGLTDDFREAVDSALGRSLLPTLNALDQVSGRTNALKRYASDLSRNLSLHKSEVPQSDVERRIALAIKNGTMSKLSEAERRAAIGINEHMADLLRRQREAGIPVEDITGKAGIKNYLPQRFNAVWMHENYDEAVNRLASWFKKEGGGDAGDAKLRAQKVIDRALSEDDDAKFLGGASDPVHRSAFSGQLYSRVLNIGAEDMEKMKLHDLFDNNLRDLVTSYTNNVEMRIESAKRLGVKGHALNTYLDVGLRGRQAAIDALMGSASGYEKVAGSYMENGVENVVSSMSQIIGPMTRDPREAEALVDGILSSLASAENVAAKKKTLVDGMVASHPSADNPAESMHFRARAEAIVNGLENFGPNGNQLAASEAVFMRDFTGRLTGEGVKMSDAEKRMQPFVRGVMAFNSVSLLSMAALSSLSDAAMPLIRSGNLAAFGKGMSVLVQQILGMGPEGAQAARNIGVGVNQAVHASLADFGGGRIGRGINGFFLANGLTPWTSAMRTTAGVIGFESIKASQLIAQRERAAGNFESRAYMKAMRYLRQLNAAELVDQPALGQMLAATDNEVVRRAVIRFTNESIFEPNRNDIPLQFQDNPFWKMAFQFKSYPMMLGRMVKRTMKEAVATEQAASGKKVYVGDVKPLAFMLTVGVGLAAGGQALRDVAAGRNEEADPGDTSAWRSIRDRKWSNIAQDLGLMEKDQGMDDEFADKAIGWYVESLLGLGALGMVGDMFYQSAKSIDNGAFGRERIASQIAGPTFGGFMSALQAVEGAMDGNPDSNSKERAGTRAVLSRVPGVASQRPWVEGLTGWIAGEKEQ